MTRLTNEIKSLSAERRAALRDRLGALLDEQAQILGEPTGVRPDPRMPSTDAAVGPGDRESAAATVPVLPSEQQSASSGAPAWLEAWDRYMKSADLGHEQAAADFGASLLAPILTSDGHHSLTVGVFTRSADKNATGGGDIVPGGSFFWARQGAWARRSTSGYDQSTDGEPVLPLDITGGEHRFLPDLTFARCLYDEVPLAALNELMRRPSTSADEPADDPSKRI